MCSGVIGSGQLGAIERAISEVQSGPGVRKRAGVYAIRDLFGRAPAVREFALAEPVASLVKGTIGPEARPVRALLFDKTPTTNWLVPWHQDLTICVSERRHVIGFGPWSIKAGIVHVQPSMDILEGMIAVRVHLDHAHSGNGALRVLPGTHRHGRLLPGDISALQNTVTEVVCEANRGDILLMKPLLLHASSPVTETGQRRVVHIEYASSDLPGGLQWHEAICA